MIYLFLLGRALALHTPRRVCYLLARGLALLKYYSSPTDRNAVLFNLENLVSDPKKRIACAKEVFVNFAYYLVDFFRFEKLDLAFIKKYVRISGEDNLRSSLSQGGVIGLTAHLGNYELGGAVVGLLGFPMWAVALPHKNKKLNDFFVKQRNHTRVQVIPTGVLIKQCIRLLRQKNFIVFLGDRDFSEGGYKLTMCNREALLPRGPAFFALKTGACILPAFCIRENLLHYHLIFEEPIYVNAEHQSEENIILSYSRVVERYLKQYPEQWYLFQKYWIE